MPALQEEAAVAMENRTAFRLLPRVLVADR